MRKNKKRTTSVFKQQLGIIKQWAIAPIPRQDYGKNARNHFALRFFLFALSKMGINRYWKRANLRIFKTFRRQVLLIKKDRESRNDYLNYLIPHFYLRPQLVNISQNSLNRITYIYNHWIKKFYYKRLWVRDIDTGNRIFLRIKRRVTQKDKKRLKNMYYTIPQFHFNMHVSDIRLSFSSRNYEINASVIMNLIELIREDEDAEEGLWKTDDLASKLRRIQLDIIQIQLTKLLEVREMIENHLTKLTGELVRIKFTNLFKLGIGGVAGDGFRLIPQFTFQGDINLEWWWVLGAQALVKSFRWKQKKRYRFLTLFKFAFLTENLDIILSLLIEWLQMENKRKKQKKTIYNLFTLINGYLPLSPTIIGLQILICGKIGGSRRTKCLYYRIGRRICQQTLLATIVYVYDTAETFTGTFGIHLWVYKDILPAGIYENITSE